MKKIIRFFVFMVSASFLMNTAFAEETQVLENILTSQAQSSVADSRCMASFLVLSHGPRTSTVSGVLTYEITVTNTGECDLENIHIRETLPGGTRLHHVSPRPMNQTPLYLFWNETRLIPHATLNFTVQVEVLPPGGRQVSNEVCATSDGILNPACSRINTEILK